MYEITDFTERVTLCEDGIYRWKGLIPKEDEKKEYFLTLKITGGICIFIIAFDGFMFATGVGDFKAFLIPVLCCVGLMLLISLIFLALYKANGYAVQYYELYDEYIRTVSSKGGFWTYQNIREIHIYDDYVGLNKKRIKRKIYCNHEDVEMVANYIMQRCQLGASLTDHRKEK